ncbi:hypothetical protein FLA_5169 [Filimonas lacunae]|nr:hypothetical protein FLA_5169 [Filimonas lacunae]
MFLIACLLSANAMIFAQVNAVTSDSVAVAVPDTLHRAAIRGANKVAVIIGTQGLGLDVSRKVNSFLAIRLGGSYLPFSTTVKGTALGDINTNVKVKSKDFVNAHLVADFYPFKKAGFRLSPGIGYFFHAKGEAKITPDANYKWNDVTLTPEQIGSSTGTLDWNGVAAFASAGYDFKATRKFPVSISLELGSYYLPAPEAHMTGEKLLSENSSNEAQFRRNTKNYRWLPVLQLSLGYAF